MAEKVGSCGKTTARKHNPPCKKMDALGTEKKTTVRRKQKESGHESARREGEAKTEGRGNRSELRRLGKALKGKKGSGESPDLGKNDGGIACRIGRILENGKARRFDGGVRNRDGKRFGKGETKGTK